MTLPAGTRLGPYEILDLVGAGGMGEVYRARDPRLGRDVAVKVLPDDIAGDRDRLRRFEREARAVAALSHPNVVVVYDVGTDAGRPYVVTELLEGETLGERLRKGALPLREAIETAVHVAHGLAAAHAKTIAHRDLKPANVFLTTDGRVKILDFGLARWEGLNPEETTASAVTGQGTCLGTVGYMSPEQVRGGRGDHRSDVFSFGVLLYEMVSGRHPFRRKTGVETQTAILREEPLALNGLGLPEALERVVLRCLEKRPEDRFHSAHDLALALQSIAGAPLTPLPPPSVAGPEPGPYPGLRPFTEEQKESFFGREAEVAALWEKLAAAEAAVSDRALGCGQDVVRASGARAGSSFRLAVRDGDAGATAVCLARAGARPGARVGHRGSAGARGVRRPRRGGAARGAVAAAARGGPRGRGPARGALHAQSSRRPGRLRGAAATPLRRGRRARAALAAGRLLLRLPRPLRRSPRSSPT